MQVFQFSSLLEMVEVRGAEGIDHTEEGVILRRLPEWTRRQLPDEMDPVVQKLSGVRLAFTTDAILVEVTARATSFVPPFTERLPVCLELDYGEGLISVERSQGDARLMNGWDPDAFEKVTGKVETWQFSLPAGTKHCELWLPHNAIIELRSLAVNEGAKLLSPDKDKRPLWVHYGSSISHCLEARRPTEVWPAVAARHTGVSLHNLGVAGQCHLDPFIARTIRDLPADLISIKAGINIVNRDTIRERAFRPVLHGFIDTIREKQPLTPITLISPIFCPAIESHPGPTARADNGDLIAIPGQHELRSGSLSLRRIRDLIEHAVKQREDSNLHYVDGLSLLGEADVEYLHDKLHPNAEGYVKIGHRYAEQHLSTMVSAST